MENDVTDRLWDKDVQGFIEACKHEKLTDITLGYTVMDDGRKILNVSAFYGSRARGLVPMGYRWAESRQAGWLPVVFVGNQATAVTHQPGALRKLTWQLGLWRERKELFAAVQAVTQVFFKAQMVRTELDSEHMKLVGEYSLERAQELTLQTLNDLAFLYSGH